MDKNLMIKVNILFIKGHNFRPIIRKCWGYYHDTECSHEILLKCSELHAAQNLLREDLQDKSIPD